MSAQNNWGRDIIGESRPQAPKKLADEGGTENKRKLADKGRLWLTLAKASKGIKILRDQPCECTRNHYAIGIGNIALCPVVFFLAVSVLRMQYTLASEFMEKHSFDELVIRIDPENDACFDKTIEIYTEKRYKMPLQVKEDHAKN